MKRKVFLIMFFLLVTNLQIVNADILTRNIVDNNDDQFRTDVGNVFDNVDLLVLKDENSELWIALRFANITIARNTIINSANISLMTMAGYTFEQNQTVTVYGFDVGNVQPFDTVSPYDLPLTTAHTVWNTSLVTGQNVRHNVSVGPIISEITAKYTYSSGNAIGFMILSPTGNQRVTYASEFSPYRGPQLFIAYNVVPTPPTGLDPDAEYNQTYNEYDVYKVPGDNFVTSTVSGMLWDSYNEVYPSQEKTAYCNVSDRFYIFGGTDDHIQYLSKPRKSATWDSAVNLTTTISGGEIYSDFHLHSLNGSNYLDIAYSDTYTGPDRVYYQRFLVNPNGTFTALTAPQEIRQLNFLSQPLSIVVDSEGYPYVVFNHHATGIYSAQVCWSNLNNGTFNHTATSPLSVESASGGNPPNDGIYAVELTSAGNRRVFLEYLSPHGIDDRSHVRSARIINSGSWVGEGDPTSELNNDKSERFALSASSIQKDSDDLNNTWLLHDQDVHELWERPVLGPSRVADFWDYTDIMVSGATNFEQYYTVGHERNNYNTLYRIRQGSWSVALPLRDFSEFGALDNIKEYQFCGQQYPLTFDGNRTIVSYAWKDQANIMFWHDWFYLDMGPQPNTEDTWEAWKNGTKEHECETLDCLIDEIDKDDPDPDDPEPGPWTPLGGFNRFNFKLLILFTGLMLLMGTPVYGLITRPEPSMWILILFAMFCGLALLWSLVGM